MELKLAARRALFAITCGASLVVACHRAGGGDAGTNTDARGAEAQRDLLGAKITKSNFKRTTHPDAQWFGEAGLGLFIHWGISSVHGGLDLSWGMMAGKSWGPPEERNVTLVTPEEYFALAERFKPDRFEPEKFLKAAKAAGFRYAVMTTRHHDGYALWPSDAGDFGVKKYLPGADFVRRYVDACRAEGLKVGLYYSPPDWHFNRDYMSFNAARSTGESPSPLYNARHEIVTNIPKPSAEQTAAYHAYLKSQIVELLTRYGKIDLMWFDGPPAVISMEELRRLQPGMVINPRMHGFGDFTTPEAAMPKARIEGWWELCDLWSSNWGYCRAHENYRSDGWMLERFTRVRGWGGNYLINAAPRGDGSMPGSYYDRMTELATWMKHSGGSVFGVQPGPFPDKSNVPVTIRGMTWYLQVPPTFKNPVVIVADHRPRKVSLLRTGETQEFDFKDATATIKISAEKRTDLVDVVAVEW
jgi:alpha-L-fucosidase